MFHTGHKGKIVNPGVRPFPSVFVKNLAGDVVEAHDYDHIDLFFLEKELHAGRKMNIYLTRNTTGATFISRKEADAIPFTSNKLSEILDKLSVMPHTTKAEAIEQVIKEFEEPSEEGEPKILVTSLESMVDLAISNLGKHVQPMSTDVEKEESAGQQYTISPGVKKIGTNTCVVCHIMNYVYPVFSCHAITSTKVFKVPLIDASGSKATAVAVCHGDNSKFDSEHLAFKILKVKPGEVPVCHFIAEGDIVWASDNKS